MMTDGRIENSKRHSVAMQAALYSEGLEGILFGVAGAQSSY